MIYLRHALQREHHPVYALARRARLLIIPILLTPGAAPDPEAKPYLLVAEPNEYQAPST
jgi:hypothetical protein